jgi:hypothetical protein
VSSLVSPRVTIWSRSRVTVSAQHRADAFWPPAVGRRIAPGLPDHAVTGLAFAAGFVGGVYGIGGGSLLGPILVGTGLSVAMVEPATLLSTFVTFIVGALTYLGSASSRRATSRPIGRWVSLAGSVA